MLTEYEKTHKREILAAWDREVLQFNFRIPMSEWDWEAYDLLAELRFGSVDTVAQGG